MSKFSFLLCSILLGSFLTSGAQKTLKGKIHSADTDSVMVGVNVFNLATLESSRSALDGTYKIEAEEGQKIVFSMTGYVPDTVAVSFSMLITTLDITMVLDPLALTEVVVTTSRYRLDSLNRRKYYNHIYEGQRGITGGNNPTSGVGISISPISFFSKESKQKRMLRKRLEKFEEEAFIDESFPAPFVQHLTWLTGDSLRLFLYRYRPSYAFCRKTDRQGMMLYINDKLKEFKKP